MNELERLLHIIDDEEWELLNYEDMDQFGKWFETKYWSWFKWYMNQPFEERQRFMSTEKLAKELNRPWDEQINEYFENSIDNITATEINFDDE